MITTVTLNSAIDRTILTDAIAYGQVNRISRGRENIGGKGVNVSKILSQLGTDSIATGFIGTDNLNKTEKMMAADGVAHDFIELPGETRTNIVIVEVDKKITTNINEAGFEVSEVDILKMKAALTKMAKKSDYMVFSGSIPKGMDNQTYYDLIELVSKDTKTLLDADDDLLIEGIKAAPTIIKPNIHELENAFDVTLDTDEAIIALCRQLIAEYGIQYTLISMGGDGSLLISADEVYKAEPVEVVVKNTVGAGDSMVGGFLHGLSNDMSLEGCLKYGSACGTLAVMTEANQIFNPKDLEKMVEKIVVKRL